MNTSLQSVKSFAGSMFTFKPIDFNPSRSLLTRLAISGTTLLVSGCAYWGYQTVRAFTLQSLQQNAFSQVEAGVGDLNHWLDTLTVKTSVMANTDTVQTVDWSVAGPYLKSEVARTPDVSALLLAEADGTYDITVKPGRKSISDRLYFQIAMQGKPNISEPVFARTLRKPIFVVASPIYQSANATGKPSGVLGMLVGIDRITQVSQQVQYGEDSYSFILNAEGQAIAHPNKDLLTITETPKPPLTESADANLAAIATRMVSRERGMETTEIDGKPVYVAFMPLEETNWSVALVIPRQNIDAQVRLLDAIALAGLLLAGTLIGVLIYVQSFEQTQLKKSKLAADAANLAKSEFLANMSHELRTPLNGILGYAQILQASKALPPKERRGADVIYDCGTHLLNLINDILDLSKIEARKLELSLHPVYLPTFLDSVVQICQIRAEQKPIQFIYQFDARLPDAIYADEKRLRQVLINLVGNAIKFTDQGSVILRVNVLEGSSELNYCRIQFAVEDTGVGIAQPDIEKLFQSFEQVGDRSRQSEGTGLGLAISQQIVQLMGGQIQVRSQLGEGSCFSFTVELPVAGESPQQLWRNAGQRMTGYQGEIRSVLVIDDRWENRSVIVNLLEPLGFHLLEAEDGEVGLQQMRRSHPDLVITDIAMPVMDGLEMLKQVRSNPDLQQQKIIVSSASVAQADQKMALEAGGDDFLGKPVNAAELFSLVAQHLQLEWQYETDSEPTHPASQTTDGVVYVPPMTDLNLLLDLARSARLKPLRQHLETLVQADPKYQGFAEPILELARRFRAEEIEALLSQYLHQIAN